MTGKRGLSPQQRRELKTAAVVLALGLGYFGLIRLTGLYIPCPFRLVTGLACPGCGVSHFFEDLLRLDVASAVQQNLAVAVLLPVWLAVWAVRFFRHPRWLRTHGPVLQALSWGSLVLVLAFGVARNLPGCSVLLPLYLR